jgi:hypothetical protein
MIQPRKQRVEAAPESKGARGPFGAAAAGIQARARLQRDPPSPSSI